LLEIKLRPELNFACDLAVHGDGVHVPAGAVAVLPGRTRRRRRERPPHHRCRRGKGTYRFPLLRALPNETKVGSGTSQSKCGTSFDLSNSEFFFVCLDPHGGVRAFHQKSTSRTKSSLGLYVVYIWSGDSPNFEATRPSKSAAWRAERSWPPK